MKTCLTLTLLGLAATAACQYLNQSAPFTLVLESNNATLNGTVLGACHEGAATEGLCYTGISVIDDPVYGTTFYYNSSLTASENDTDTWGSLGYDLHAGGNVSYPSVMAFSYDPSSNIAIPIITPGEYPSTYVSFDSCGHLYIQDYQDDTVSPPAYYDPVKKLENWYVCLTSWSYTYETLVWKVGTIGEPQNPTCSKTRVKRVFT